MKEGAAPNLSGHSKEVEKAALLLGWAILHGGKIVFNVMSGIRGPCFPNIATNVTVLPLASCLWVLQVPFGVDDAVHPSS